MVAEQGKRTIEKILDAYFSGTLPLDVELDILSWIMYGGHRAEKDAKLELLWNSIVCYEEHPADQEKVLRSLAAVKVRLGLPPVEMTPTAPAAPVKPVKTLRRRIIFRVAAVVLPLLVAGGALLYLERGDEGEKQPVVVSSSERMLEVVLPDSSRVWLKKGAALTYPEVFDGERTMTLEGEAYFKVRRDEGRPFVVNTESLAVRVLGTEFSISALPSEKEAVVTLASGKVAVEVDGEEHIIDRRAKLTYDKEQKNVVTEDVGTGESADWRGMSFEYVGLNTVLDALSERYNIAIERDSAAFTGEIVTLKLEGGESLDVALLRLEYITDSFTHRIEEGKVIIETK